MSATDPFSSPLLPEGLREALRLSPNNPPLLVHAAETLLKSGGFPEAEQLFKRALSGSPDSVGAKVGLAEAFFQQGKYSAALVVVEDMTKVAKPAPRALVLHARLALNAGE